MKANLYLNGKQIEESRVWIETEQISCSKAFAFCNSHLSGTILACRNTDNMPLSWSFI